MTTGETDVMHWTNKVTHNKSLSKAHRVLEDMKYVCGRALKKEWECFPQEMASTRMSQNIAWMEGRGPQKGMHLRETENRNWFLSGAENNHPLVVWTMTVCSAWVPNYSSLSMWPKGHSQNNCTVSPAPSQIKHRRLKCQYCHHLKVTTS